MRSLRARALVDRLWNSDNAADNARLQAQARLIAAYEEGKWPRRRRARPNWIRHFMDQHGLTRADIRDSRNAEPGERGPGSKKALSMAMVRRLRAAFSRVDLLIPPLKQARRTPKRAATGYWNNTAIFITWDDWGGWYDHEPPTILAPPQGDYQYGFRVPLLAVSACTPSGYINNGRHDFGSILRFIEHNFRIPEGALNFADARAKDNLTGFFNLSAAPRAFHKISAAKDAAFFLTDQRPATNPDDD